MRFSLLHQLSVAEISDTFSHSVDFDKSLDSKVKTKYKFSDTDKYNG
jgi:hypothetical protein